MGFEIIETGAYHFSFLTLGKFTTLWVHRNTKQNTPLPASEGINEIMAVKMVRRCYMLYYHGFPPFLPSLLSFPRCLMSIEQESVCFQLIVVNWFLNSRYKVFSKQNREPSNSYILIGDIIAPTEAKIGSGGVKKF